MSELEPQELDARFASFAAVPRPALPGAAAAQARGDQRTRRTRAALGAAAAAVLVLTAGVAVGAGGGVDRDRVVPPRVASAEPDPGPAGLSAGLLDPATASRALSEPWEVRAEEDLPFDPLPAGCAGDVAPAAPTATALGFLDGDGDRVIGHALREYATAEQAQAAYARLVGAVRACGEGGPAQLVAGQPVPPGPQRTYGTFPAGDATVVFAVEHVGPVLSGVAIRSFELDDVEALADVAAEKVRAQLGVAEPVRQGPSGLLTPQDAATVEAGPWTTTPFESDRHLLSVCAAELDPQPARVEGIQLNVEREAGGTVVAQQVYAYASAALAEQALAAVRVAAGACPRDPRIFADLSPIPTYEVVPGTELGTLLVAVTSTCDQCLPDVSYAAAVQVDSRLTVLRVSVGEDGGTNPDLAQRYAAAAAERLRQTP